jgi:hypothetical protein
VRRAELMKEGSMHRELCLGTRLGVLQLPAIQIVVVVGALFAAGCSRTRERTSTVQEDLIEAGSIVSIGGTNNSPSAVGVGSNVDNQKLVVGFTNLSGGEGGPMGWAYSNSGGTSFTRCNADSVSCGFSVTKATNQSAWKGDASLAAEGRHLVSGNFVNSGNIMYATLGATTSAGSADMVIATISNDYGLHFGLYSGDTVQVNDTTGNCPSGTVASPSAAIDPTTSPVTVWIAWAVASGSSPAICVRRGHFGSTNAFAFDDVLQNSP